MDHLDDNENLVLINKLRGILRCLVKRNPTIGYCQGMNFIACRLLKILREEETFWVMCMILESKLPLDYYTNMVGLLVDQQVFKDLISKLLPKLSKHLEEIGFDPSLLVFQWFVSIYSNNINETVSSMLLTFIAEP
jgi:hypothetical protein